MLKVGIVGLGGRMGHALYECCLGLDGAKTLTEKIGRITRGEDND